MATGKIQPRRTRSNATSKSASAAAKGGKSRKMSNVRAKRTQKSSSTKDMPSKRESKAVIPKLTNTARAQLIRDQLGRKKGTLATFEDKLTALRVYANLILDGNYLTHNSACSGVVTCLQMSLKKVREIVEEFDKCGGDVYNLAIMNKTTRGTASEHYSFEHLIIKKEMLMFCHEYCLKKLSEEGAMSSYAELHRVFEDKFDLGVSAEALRLRLIKDFDYAFFRIPYDNASVKITFQTRRFLLLYSNALNRQARGECIIAYMDETWVWRYHSMKKGAAPRDATRGGVKSGKGDRLIVLDAITADGPLRYDGSEDGSQNEEASDRSSSGDSDASEDEDSEDEDSEYDEIEDDKMMSALWTWLYQKKGDYHDAMNFAKFKDWVNKRFIPTWKRRYPGVPCCLVLDNAPYHMGGMQNPFVMNKKECADYLRSAGLSNVVVHRDDGKPLHHFKVPARGSDFAKAPKGPSTEELRQAVFDTMEDINPDLLRTWIEARFEEEGWTIIFTPPYLCNFQPIELFWAYIKNSIGRRYFKGRDMAWIASEFAKRALQINCADLIRHAHEFMDTWISLDTILSGSFLDIKIADEEMRSRIMNNNPKFLSETEMEELQNPEEYTVYFEVDDEGDVH